MTATYAPDVAPDLEPKVVRWQPAHATGGRETGAFLSWTGLAVAVVGVAALAVGAAAVTALLRDERRTRTRLIDLGRLSHLAQRRLGLERRRRPF